MRRQVRTLIVVSACAAVVGCGDVNGPVTELPAGTSHEFDATLYDDSGVDAGGDARVDDSSDDGGVAVGSDPSIDVASGNDGVDVDGEAVEVSDGSIDNDAAEDSDAGVDDEGGTNMGRDPAADDDVVFVDAYVGHVGGVLVKDLCGWPGPLCEPDGDVAPIDEGGRLWWRPRSNWEPWIGRVLDMCDDHEALTAIAGSAWTGYKRGIDYGAKIPSYEMERIVKERQHYPIVCSDAEAAVPNWKCVGGSSQLRTYLEGFEEPPASSVVLAWVENQGLDCLDTAAERRRYTYVTVDGPMFPQSSVEAAAEAHREAVERYSGRPGVPLGTSGSPYYPFEAPQDEVVVLEWSLSVIDGVVRGLAQNQSESLWARSVAVTATDAAGTEATGLLALVVQPGEAMPFEIEDWTGSQSLSEISFEISADLSPTIDLSRSLKLDSHHWHLTKDAYLREFPAEMVAGAIPDGEFEFIAVVINPTAPKSHPHLGEAALDHEIEHLAVYGATFDFETAAVVDVFELTPRTRVSSPGSPTEWTEIASIPAELADGRLASVATVGTLSQNYNALLIWAGEAA